MHINDWVMTNAYVGQLWKQGGMYSQIQVRDSQGLNHHVIVPTDEMRIISKEVADIIRSV